MRNAEASEEFHAFIAPNVGLDYEQAAGDMVEYREAATSEGLCSPGSLPNAIRSIDKRVRWSR